MAKGWVEPREAAVTTRHLMRMKRGAGHGGAGGVSFRLSLQNAFKVGYKYVTVYDNRSAKDVRMGRKAIANEEAVFRAADLVSAAGRNVTAAAVRDSIGGGGLSTIQSHIQNWRQKQDGAVAAAHLANTLPAPLRNSVEQLRRELKTLENVLRVYHQQESKEHLKTQIEELHDQVSAKDKRIEELEEYIKGLESERNSDTSESVGRAGRVSDKRGATKETRPKTTKTRNDVPKDDGDQGSLF